jgi:hypothetical protein
MRERGRSRDGIDSERRSTQWSSVKGQATETTRVTGDTPGFPEKTQIREGYSEHKHTRHIHIHIHTGTLAASH